MGKVETGIRYVGRRAPDLRPLFLPRHLDGLARRTGSRPEVGSVVGATVFTPRRDGFTAQRRKMITSCVSIAVFRETKKF